MLSKPRSFALAAVITSLGIAGCGGDDSGKSDEKDIADAAKLGFTTTDLKIKCEEIISESFLREVYGDVDQCRKAEKPDPDDKPTTDVTTSDIVITGDKATAKVVLKGGSANGATGTLELRREDGSWRVNDLGADLLRSNLESEIRNDSSEQFADPQVKDCAIKTFTTLPDEQLQTVAYAAIGEREGSDEQLGKLLVPCLSKGGDDGISFLRKKFEEGIEQSAKKDGASDKVIACVKAELRKTISDEDIAALAQQGGKSNTEVTQRAARAIVACRGSKG